MSTVTIDAKQVAALREKTGAGMLNCRKALVDANGDFEAAVDLLRATGAATTAKLAGRAAKEGLIAQAILPGAKAGLLLEINCETDFVAKNEDFQKTAASWAKTLAENPSADLEPARVDAVSKIRENIQIRRNVRFDVAGNGSVAAYIHLGGKIGVLLELGTGKAETVNSDEFKQLMRDITLHIAAANPVALKREEVASALVERERAIYREQAPKDKAPEMIEKIIDGKMGKFYGGVCLLEQPFVKNPEQIVKALVEEKAKALGDTLEVRRFARFQVGEEIAG